MKWFRFYSEFAHDPKVQSMPEAMQRRLCMIFCLHCDGSLAGLDDEMVAFALKISMDDLKETKTLFQKRGFIGKSWVPSNWEKRQFKSDTSAERTRSYRKRISGVTSQNPAGDEPVTSHERHGDALDTDTETESDTEKENPPVVPQTGDVTQTSPPIASGRSAEDRAELEQAITILAADLRTHAVAMELGRRHTGQRLLAIPGWKWVVAAMKLQGENITASQQESLAYLRGIAERVKPEERLKATPPSGISVYPQPVLRKTQAQLRAEEDKAKIERMLARKRAEREAEARADQQAS